MTRKEELHDMLRRSFDGEAWHGPALADALADVRAEEALWRPARHAHSIWEITVHAGGWALEVASRLRGGEPKEPEDGDWPAPDESAGEDGWQDAIQRLFNSRDVALAAVRAQSDDELDVMVGTSIDPPLGTGFSRAGLIAGLAQHNCYHAGQISLIKKVIRCVV